MRDTVPAANRQANHRRIAVAATLRQSTKASGASHRKASGASHRKASRANVGKASGASNGPGDTFSNSRFPECHTIGHSQVCPNPSPQNSSPRPPIPSVSNGLNDLRALASGLDDAFSIPGTGIRFGWDSIIGLAPGAGDVVTALLAAYIVAEAAKLGVPKRTLLRMAANVGVDLGIGAIPLLGDLFDLAFKANRKNMKLLEKHVARDV